MTKVSIRIESDCFAWIAGARKLGSDFLAYLTPQKPTASLEFKPGLYEVVLASHTNPQGKTAKITVGTSATNSISKDVSVDNDGDLIEHFYFRVTDTGEVQ